ncbi:MAG: ECF-type sigma factor, partial [Acidobacteriota bacterium]
MLYCAIITSKDSAPNEITETLRTWASGNAEALDSLAPLVYDRMRRLAASFLRHERHDHTLQTTALIHEAFLRLVQQQRVTYENREQFFANAGRMMRRILVDHARARSVRKRGSGAEPLPIEVAKQLPIPERPLDMLALDDALQELTATHPDLGLIVELKFFVGLSVAETAAVTGRGSATVQRRWQ